MYCYSTNRDFIYVSNKPYNYLDPIGLSIFGDIWNWIKKASRVIWGFFSSPIEGSNCTDYCVYENPSVQCQAQCLECCQKYCPFASPEYDTCYTMCLEKEPWPQCPPPSTDEEGKK